MAISTFEADEIVARANVNQRINQANAYFPVSVANGGTGRTSLTSGQILLGNGTSGVTGTGKLPVTKGGTGRQELAAGQILIGNGTGGIIGTAILPQSKGGTGVSSFYETGSWTPEFHMASYTSRSGIYVRIRDWVYVHFYVNGTNQSSGAPFALMTGLPFSAKSGREYPLSLVQHHGIFNESGHLVAVVDGSWIEIKNTSGWSIATLVAGGSGGFSFGGWYQKA